MPHQSPPEGEAPPGPGSCPSRVKGSGQPAVLTSSGAAQPSRGSPGGGQRSVLGTTRGRGELPQGPWRSRSAGAALVRRCGHTAHLQACQTLQQLKGTLDFMVTTSSPSPLSPRAESLPELSTGLLENIMGIPGSWAFQEEGRREGAQGVCGHREPPLHESLRSHPENALGDFSLAPFTDRLAPLGWGPPGRAEPGLD